MQGVGFKIDEIELEEDIRVAYNKSVDLWVDLLHKFQARENIYGLFYYITSL